MSVSLPNLSFEVTLIVTFPLYLSFISPSSSLLCLLLSLTLPLKTVMKPANIVFLPLQRKSVRPPPAHTHTQNIQKIPKMPPVHGIQMCTHKLVHVVTYLQHTYMHSDTYTVAYCANVAYIYKMLSKWTKENSINSFGETPLCLQNSINSSGFSSTKSGVL